MGWIEQNQTLALPTRYKPDKKKKKKNNPKLNIYRKILVQLQDKPSFLLSTRGNRLKINPS